MPQAKPGSWWQALSSLVGLWSSKLFAVFQLLFEAWRFLLWSPHPTQLASTTASHPISAQIQGGEIVHHEKKKIRENPRSKKMFVRVDELGKECTRVNLSWLWKLMVGLFQEFDYVKSSSGLEPTKMEFLLHRHWDSQKSETFTVNTLQSRLVTGKTCQGNHQIGRTRLCQIFNPKQ